MSSGILMPGILLAFCAGFPGNASSFAQRHLIFGGSSIDPSRKRKRDPRMAAWWEDEPVPQRRTTLPPAKLKLPSAQETWKIVKHMVSASPPAIA